VLAFHPFYAIAIIVSPPILAFIIIRAEKMIAEDY